MDFLLSIINSMLIFLPIQSVLMIVAMITKCSDFVVPSIIVFLVSIFSDIFFKVIKNGALCVLSGIALIFVCYPFTDGGDRILTMVFSAFFVGIKIFERLKNKQIHGYGEMMMIIYGVLGIVVVAMGNEKMIAACVICAVFYIVLKYVFEGLSNTNDFLEINQKIAELPVKTIKRKTRMTMLPFVLIILAGVVVGIKSGLGELITALFLLFWNFLKGIFARERVEIDIDKTEENVFSFRNDMNMDRLLEDFGERRMAPALMEPIIKIIFSIIAVIIVLVLIKALFVILKDFIKALYENKNGDNKDELLIKDEAEFFMFKKPKKIYSKIKDSLPNNAKIRRLYKKYIFKFKDVELSKNYTTLEISKTLNIDTLKNDSKIRGLYQKARYSKNECTTEEVGLMKSLIKEFSKE